LNRIIGYTHLLLNAAGAVFSGVLGIAFVVLAVYLAYSNIGSDPQFQLNHLMMPMMNILISSVLFFYCRRLSASTAAVQRNLSSNSYTPPRIKATKYDTIAIVAFVSFVALVCIFLIRR
jgi:hypothetical protein